VAEQKIRRLSAVRKKKATVDGLLRQ